MNLQSGFLSCVEISLLSEGIKRKSFTSAQCARNIKESITTLSKPTPDFAFITLHFNFPPLYGTIVPSAFHNNNPAYLDRSAIHIGALCRAKTSGRKSAAIFQQRREKRSQWRSRVNWIYRFSSTHTSKGISPMLKHARDEKGAL